MNSIFFLSWYSVNGLYSTSSTVIPVGTSLFSTYVVPSGTFPTTLIFATSSLPVLDTVTVYFIISPSFTSCVLSSPATKAFKVVSITGPFPVSNVNLSNSTDDSVELFVFV